MVGYTSVAEPAVSTLHLIFSDGPESVPFDESAFDELPVESYAMRPCLHRSVCDVMLGEMQSFHKQVSADFNGEGRQRRATRNLATIFWRYDILPTDEETQIPLYDCSRGQVPRVSIKSVLNYVYYNSGRRRPPANIEVGATLFTSLL